LTTLKETGGKILGKEFGKFGDFYRWFAMDPDPAKSKALPSRLTYVNVNLKGRDPEGIVEPADYPKVQQEIIDALLTYVDPETGKRPVSLALAKSDARLLGLHGDGVGDVIYAVYPWFGIAQHGPYLQTAEYGIGKMGVLAAAMGPGIKENQQLERTMYLADIVPTICYLMNWPVPSDAEGAVVYQALVDPSIKVNQ
jgi:predicted AlkP superfamily phosphohydrolase/phosphomutase